MGYWVGNAVQVAGLAQGLSLGLAGSKSLLH